MKLVKSIVTNNPCYKAGRTITVKGLMLHSVGCPQPKASVFINQFNKSSYDRACVHAFIDANDGTIYQTLPWNHRGWHGGGASNNTHIGVEMCEPNCIKYTGGSTFTCSNLAKAQEMVTRTYNSAVELFADLCKQYKLNPLTDIISHSEGYKKGIATNHGDPKHLWKGVKLPYTMHTFRADVKSKMNGDITLITPTTSANTETSTTFKVRVSITNLNVRKGAGLSFGVVGLCPKGVYTIVDTKTKDGYEWGKLKSGMGWIALKYTQRL